MKLTLPTFFVAMLLLCGNRASTAQVAACDDLAVLAANGQLPVKTVFTFVNSATCLTNEAQQLGRILPGQFNANAYLPQKRDFLVALQNYASNQQNSAAPSTASTSPVSKPSGPTAIIEEFGGLKVTPGTSSTTFQFSPGTFLQNLGNSEVLPFCSSALQITTKCIHTGVTGFLLHWTFALMTQTSSNTQSATGIAGGTTSQPVSFLTGATANPTFAGTSVKWALFGKAKFTETAASKNVVLEVSEQNLSSANCPEFGEWQDGAVKAFEAANDLEAQKKSVNDSYRKLLLDPRARGSCLRAVLDNHAKLLTDYLIADAADDLRMGTTPWLGLEYDLATPTGKPSYSSAKLNFSHQFGKPTVTPVAGSSLCAFAATVALKAGQSGQNSTSCLGNSVQANTSEASKTSAAATTMPFTVNASFTADVFNSDQTSIAPSASRLRDFQGAVELDYIVPLLKISPTRPVYKYLIQKIGDPTLAGSYLYQDQTSPSILTGPPSTITFVGLPTTASTAYTSTGPIHLAQIRLGLGNGTNLKFPIAATYSNRSELVSHRTFGLQLGLSYNLTSGLSK